MNVLVVGGAGYIGSHCVRQLVEAGHRPVVLDNLVYGHREAVAPEVAFHEGDLGDRAFVEKVLREEQIEVVMHFAAFAYVGESMSDPLKYYDNNIAKTVALLEAMRAAGVTKFVFSSSCTIFGYAEEMPITEATPIHPISVYGYTKADAEKMLAACADAYGMSVACFRYFNASGAAADGTIGEDHDPETHLIPLAIWAAQGKRAELTVFGTDYNTPDGTCLRDYVHIDDLARAHIAVFPQLEEPGAKLYYNLGTGTPASVLEVIQTVEAVTGLKVPYKLGERRPGDADAAYADNTKARTELGWEPHYKDIRSIVESAWKWHQAHPDGFAG
ncbi:MAG: UDP-glucose 4-epimerase GalE [Opitutales bacterium]